MGCANSSCKNCNGTCNTKQNLCKISSQSATSYGGSFSWPKSPGGQETIAKVWTASAWNQLKGMLDSAYKAGSQCSSGGQSFGSNTMPTVSKDQIITADIFNAAAAALNKLNGAGSVPSVTGGGENGTIIRNYHASMMQDKYNSGLISTLACNECNTACDVTCNGCIGCVSCQGVQHYSTCYTCNCYSG